MNMRRIIALLLILLLSGLAVAQETNRRLEAFQENFREGSQPIKLQILQQARELPPEEMGPLYGQAIEYVLSNSPSLDSDVILQEIAGLTVDGIVASNHTDSLENLWLLFEEYRDIEARRRILAALAEVGQGDEQTVFFINGWVQAQNNLKRAGTVPDLQVMLAAVDALSELSDPASFPVLVDTILVQHSATITAAAREGLFALDTDPVARANEMIAARNAQDKMPVLEFFLAADELSEEQRGEIALATLRDALSITTRSVVIVRELRQVRYRAVDYLRDQEYPPASEALINHFNDIFLAFDRGQVRKVFVLDAIAALGTVGTEEAAARLSDFLNLLNTYTENDRAYDTEITMATILNLEQLGHPVAYDSLFYASLLDYPAQVKSAAREAMAAIQ
jgi:hypothetical protein